jgi:hypothetical protein
MARQREHRVGVGVDLQAVRIVRALVRADGHVHAAASLERDVLRPCRRPREPRVLQRRQSRHDPFLRSVPVARDRGRRSVATAAEVRSRGSVPAADASGDVENEAIREIVRRQEEIGLQSVTDGEFRRARGTWTSSSSPTGSRRSRSPRSQGPQTRGRHEFTPRRCRWTASSASRRRSSAARSSPAADGDDEDPEADDPIAEHGSLPRRPRCVSTRAVSAERGALG